LKETFLHAALGSASTSAQQADMAVGFISSANGPDRAAVQAGHLDTRRLYALIYNEQFAERYKLDRRAKFKHSIVRLAASANVVTVVEYRESHFDRAFFPVDHSWPTDADGDPLNGKCRCWTKNCLWTPNSDEAKGEHPAATIANSGGIRTRRSCGHANKLQSRSPTRSCPTIAHAMFKLKAKTPDSNIRPSVDNGHAH
jgi:hypothetical protein